MYGFAIWLTQRKRLDGLGWTGHRMKAKLIKPSIFITHKDAKNCMEGRINSESAFSHNEWADEHS